MLPNRLAGLVTVLFCLVVTYANAQSIEPLPAIANKDVQIWWGPVIMATDAYGAINFGIHDFSNLMNDPVEWPQTRSVIATLELPGGIFPGYAQMPNIIHWLNNHPRIKVNMTGEYVATGGTCGSGEGFTPDLVYSVEAAVSAQAWQQAGGRLDYSVMDAPLLYARSPTSKGGCGWSIQQIAENVSQTMKVMMHYFPDIKFIDAEGPSTELTSEWLADMKQFHNALKALGTPVYATEIDEGWHTMLNGQTYAEVVSRAITFFHINGEHVGLILDLDGTASDEANDSAYLQQYRVNAQTIVNGKFGEDFVAVESWDWNRPTYNFPETSGTAFSSIIPLLQKLLSVSTQ